MPDLAPARRARIGSSGRPTENVLASDTEDAKDDDDVQREQGEQQHEQGEQSPRHETRSQ
jgi:hypothetical protein